MAERSPYAPPESALTAYASELYRNKDYLIAETDASWPSRCLKCNAETQTVKKFTLSYVTPWVFLTLLITPIVTIILGAILQKKWPTELPLCETHINKRRRFLQLQWSLTAMVVAGFIASAVIGSPLLAMGALLVLLWVVVAGTARRTVYVAKFKQGRIWIRGFGKGFLESVPEFPG